MAKGYTFHDVKGIFCEYHSRDKIVDTPELLDKVVKISKKDLAYCPACQQSILDGCKNWTRRL